MKTNDISLLGLLAGSLHPPTERSPDFFHRLEEIKASSIGWKNSRLLPPQFSTPLGIVPSPMNNKTEHAIKEVGGRGGAYK